MKSIKDGNDENIESFKKSIEEISHSADCVKNIVLLAGNYLTAIDLILSKYKLKLATIEK